MTTKTLLICVLEKEYAKHLADYIARHHEYAFAVHYCDSLSLARQIAADRQIDYLLIDSRFSPEDRESIDAVRRFLLTERPDEEAGDSEVALFRYRAGKEILGEMLESCPEEKPINLEKTKGKRAKRVAFYSPLRRLGQTSLALKLAGELAKKDSCLYMNLCPHEDPERFAEDERAASMDDLIYSFRQETNGLAGRLGAMVGQKNGYDCLRPFAVASDIEEIEPDEWQRLLGQIEESGRYGYIILDLHDGVRGLRSILRGCDRIFMPVLADPYAQKKPERFSEEMRILNEAELIGRIRKIPMEKEEDRLAASCVKALASGQGYDAVV